MNRTAILEQIQKNVERLSAPDLPEYKYIPLHQKPSPSVATLHEIMRLLRTVIFPGFFGTEQEAQLGSIQYYTGVYLEKIYDLLQEQIYNGLCFEVERCCDSKDRASEISIAFINRIPHIKYLLSTDVKAILDGDPAAKSVSEIIFCYPAVYALLHQRVAHELFELGVPVLPRIITEMAHSQTGIDIHPRGADRRIFQYRSWNGYCRGTNRHYRKPCPPLSRCDVRSQEFYAGRGRTSDRFAPSPDHRGLCDHLFQRIHIRTDHYWPRIYYRG